MIKRLLGRAVKIWASTPTRHALVLLAAVFGSQVVLGQCPPNFDAAVRYPTLLRALSVVSGDFNLDGTPDLAVVGDIESGISLLFGSGAGSFQPAINYQLAESAFALAVGDFNGDQVPDLAACNLGSGTISVLIGNGTTLNPFRPAISVPCGPVPLSIAIADFNRDGIPDLATNRLSGIISVLTGNGDGTFQAAREYVAGSRADSLAVADFNGDNFPDLATVSTESDTTSVMLNTGNGTFGPPNVFVVGSQPRCVVSGDFNADGRADLAICTYGNGRVFVLLGDGNGSFQYGVIQGPLRYPVAMSLTDFNVDGRIDIVIANEFGPLALPGGGATVMLGNGDGTFDSGTYFLTGDRPYSVIARDFNGDGAPDFAVANFGGSNIGSSCASVLLQTVGPRPPTIVAQPIARSVFAGDSVSFALAVTSPPNTTTPTFRWRRNGLPLSNSGTVLGTTGSMLVLTSATLGDDGAIFDCVISNTCDSVTSSPAMLSVTWRCPADFDHSGAAEVADIFDFLAAWFQSDPRAEFNGDGHIDIGDIFSFLGRWFARC